MSTPQTPAPFGVWQPIKTAPKDGSWMLVTCGGIFTPAVARWDDEVDMWVEIEDAPETWSEPEDWQLTHWMPLPPPPP
jgi:hypothetical protein